MTIVCQRGYPLTLAIFAPVGEFLRSETRRKWRERLEEIDRGFGLPVRRFVSPPTRAQELWDDAILFRAWLNRHHGKSGRIVLHCMNTRAASIGLRIASSDRRYRVVFDCRGAEAAEYLYINGYGRSDQAPERVRRNYEVLRERERQVSLNCHALICTSEAMKSEFLRTWSVPSKKMSIVPCCTDVDAGERAAGGRDAMRQRLGLNDHFVVAYCGSLFPWQMLPQCLCLFRRIAALKSNAHFLALTTNITRMQEVVDKAGVPPSNRTVLSVAHTDVPAFLAAADIGLLIREPSIVNRVASPTKFAEYLSCGVPVVLSEGIGDYSELVRDQGLGCVLPSVIVDKGSEDLLRSFISILEGSAETFRKRCIATARAKLGWRSVVDTICGVYGDLACR